MRRLLRERRAAFPTLHLVVAGSMILMFASSQPASAQPRPPSYPQSNATSKPIRQVLEEILTNQSSCSSFYLDTKQEHARREGGGRNHHQGLARTEKLSDGSIYFFLTHSVIGGKGQLMQFRLDATTETDHPLNASPRTVATLVEERPLDDEHPSDLVYLPDVVANSGYLFVTREYQQSDIEVFHWQAGQPLKSLGLLEPKPFDVKNGSDKPLFIALDRVGDTYYLAVMNAHHVRGYTAPQAQLFPVQGEAGRLDLKAFTAHPEQPKPDFKGASQVKLIRDSTGAWYLLGFRAEPSNDPNGADYVDVYPVELGEGKITISDPVFSQNVVLPSGDTGFASTGTHYVESSGRMLLSSSYRWAKDERSGGAGYVSRVDECPSGIVTP